MTEKPRILILTTAYLPLIGGSELAIQHLTDRMEGYDFDIVTGRYAPEMPIAEKIGRVHVFRAGGRLARLTLILPKVGMPLAMAVTALRLLRKRPYALIHAYQASQAAGAGWLVRLMYSRIPLLLTVQEGKELTSQPVLLRFFRSILLRSATRITVLSAYLAAYVHRFTRAPIDIIPNGVDTHLFVPGTRNPGHTVISVSRLVPKNGLEQLIRAMPYVQHQYPDAKLIIVGDGRLREKIAVLRDQLSVHVDVVGSVPHDSLPTHLHQADVFVRPSLSEGFGSAFLEAMACGVPVVGSAVGGIPDFLTHEQTGLVCDPREPADIAKQIIRIFEDASLRKRIVDNALALVHEQYDWSAIAQRMDAVYTTLI